MITWRPWHALPSNQPLGFICNVRHRLDAVREPPIRPAAHCRLGLGLQFALPLFVLKTAPGRKLFEGAQQLFEGLIACSDAGASFLFGSLTTDASFQATVAFRALPIIIFVSALSGLLYHLRVIQRVVKGMAWVMHKTMDISGAESLAYQSMQGMVEELEPRSVTIATYALCGFANFGSVAILIGGIGGLVPTRRGEVAALAIKALIAGTLAAFTTACVAGLLV